MQIIILFGIIFIFLILPASVMVWRMQKLEKTFEKEIKEFNQKRGF